MDLILQIAAIGALLALTVLVVLSDATGREHDEARPRRRKLRALPSPPADERSDPEAPAPGDAESPPTATITDLPRDRHEPPEILPLPLGREAIQAALRHREIGQPMVQPDPERLVQYEVLELDGPAARIGALLRLVFWIMLAGLGIGAVVLGAVRGITSLVENLLGA